MARHYRGDLAQLTPEEVSAYLLHMVKERHLSFIDPARIIRQFRSG